MNIEFNLDEVNNEYLAQTGDIVKDADGDLYLVVSNAYGTYNLLGLTYGKGELLFIEGKKHDELTVNSLPVKLVEKSKNVTIEIKTKGE